MKDQQQAKTVYNAFTRQVAFEGTAEQCMNWIMRQAFTLSNGNKLVRTWEENGDTFYDVGPVYIFNK